MLVMTGRAWPCSLSAASSGAWQRDQLLPSFTFGLDVAMRMRHFPWLGFRMQGIGRYVPGESYVVHFDRLPWFAPRQQHDADLSMLDPGLWPERFTYQLVGEQGGNMIFTLQSLEDPTLTNAVVALGPKWCARQVDAAYNDGTHIKMKVNFSDIDGFRLPASLTAEVDVPHESLSATGNFTDYAFASQPSASAPAMMPPPNDAK
jgi:hypothetical protein